MLSDDIKDRLKPLEDIPHEEDLNDLKNDFDMKHLYIPILPLDELISIQYIALIINTKLNVVLTEKGQFRNHNL